MVPRARTLTGSNCFGVSWAMSALAKLPYPMPARAFLAWDPGDGLRYELVDGEPRATAPASTVHGFLQNELGRLIGNHLRSHRPGCEVVTNPGVVPHLLAAHNFRIPDLGVTCAPLGLGQAALSDPVLLIEILSPGNQTQTWSNVWAYTSIPSVQEILVLHSTRVAAELLSRTPAGQWPKEPALLMTGEMTLASIAFAVPLEALYKRTGLLD